MNRLLVIAGFSFAVAIFGNCKAVRSTLSAGEAVERVGTFWKLQNNIDTPYIVISEKAWYQDSIGITQLCRIWFIEEDSSQTIEIRTTGYRFVDLKKKWVYEYAGFTDTASVKRKYRYTDTTYFSGGWNFANRTPSSVDSFSYLPDTTINAITYKRCKVSYLFNKARYRGICLLRCNKKNTYFQIDTAISNKVGCTLVSVSQYPVNYPHSRINSEVKFISDYLPDSVVKVFAAWKKNETIYPVQ